MFKEIKRSFGEYNWWCISARWRLVMFALIPLSLIFIKLFRAHSQQKIYKSQQKNKHFPIENNSLTIWLLNAKCKND